MITEDEIQERIEASIQIKQALIAQTSLLKALAELWTQAIRDGHKLVFFGNGGSAADAQHLACELAGRFYLERKAIPALSLTVNTSSITAMALGPELAAVPSSVMIPGCSRRARRIKQNVLRTHLAQSASS